MSLVSTSGGPDMLVKPPKRSGRMNQAYQTKLRTQSLRSSCISGTPAQVFEQNLTECNLFHSAMCKKDEFSENVQTGFLKTGESGIRATERRSELKANRWEARWRTGTYAAMPTHAQSCSTRTSASNV